MKKCRLNYKQYFTDNLVYKEDHFPRMKAKRFWCLLQYIRMFFRWNLDYSTYYVRFYYDRKHWIKDTKRRPIHLPTEQEDKLLKRSKRRTKYSYLTNNIFFRPLFLVLVPIAYALIVIAVALVVVVIPIMLLFGDLKINDSKTISWLIKKNKVE